MHELDRCRFCEPDGPGHTPEAFGICRALIDRHGADVEITVMGLGKWSVPREYIGLHGLTGVDLPALADRWGWERLP